MGYSYDVTNDIGKVRMLIPDRDPAALALQDEEIAAILTIEPNILRAAALSLETIASDLAASLRVTIILGMEVDGVKASDALLKRSNMLRAQADTLDMRDGGGFDWAEMVFDEFTARERFFSELVKTP